MLTMNDVVDAGRFTSLQKPGCDTDMARLWFIFYNTVQHLYLVLLVIVV